MDRIPKEKATFIHMTFKEAHYDNIVYAQLPNPD